MTDDLNDLIDRDLSAEDPRWILLRGHLWVEHELVRLTREVLHRPDALNYVQWNFLQLMELGVGLGVVPEELEPACRKVNSLRNRAAHDVGFEFRPEHERDLVNTLGKAERYFAMVDESAKFPENLRRVLGLLIVGMQHQREGVHRRKESTRELNQRLQQLKRRLRDDRLYRTERRDP